MPDWRRLAVGCELGECPRWQPQEGRLYWLDVPRSRLHAWQLATDTHQSWTLPERASSLAFTSAGDLLLTPAWGFVRWTPGSRDWTPLAAPERGGPNRFNDGAVDPRGRFWACTLNPAKEPTNYLYRLTAGEAPVRIDGGYRAGNGIAWSPCGETMYVVDSGRRVIVAYAVDLADGRPHRRRDWVEFGTEGVPDGITVDAEGHLWCALWGGGRVVRLSPEGRVVAELELPVDHPTSCTFIGPDRHTLAVTSAVSPGRVRQMPEGDLFFHDVDVPGLAPTLYAG